MGDNNYINNLKLKDRCLETNANERNNGIRVIFPETMTKMTGKKKTNGDKEASGIKLNIMMKKVTKIGKVMAGRVMIGLGTTGMAKMMKN